MTDDDDRDGGNEEERRSETREEPLGDLADEVRNGGGPDDGEDAIPGGPDEDGPASEREGPLSEVASEIDAAVEDQGDPPGDGLFEEGADVGEVDREALWRQVAGEDAAAEVAEETVRGEFEDGPAVRRPDAGTEGVTVEERTERVVEKAKYCHSCQYFSEPPDVHCTHDGTEIMEMVDVDHFRLANCPVVAEDEELENV